MYDGGQLAAEANAGGAILRRYVPGPGVDETLALIDANGVSYAMNDQRNTPSAWADAAGNPSVQLYGAFGEEGPANVGRIGFTGQMRIPELGLAYYKARFYDPQIGRFLTPDPAGYVDGPNLYAYVLNDPINFTDPSGLRVFVIARPTLAPGSFHQAIFVADCLGCPPSAQLSAGPSGGFLGGIIGGRLTDQTFGGRAGIGKNDLEAFKALRNQPYDAFFRVREIYNLPDANAIQMIEMIRETLNEEVIPYSLLPELFGGCNSNCVPGAVLGRRIELGVGTPGSESFRRRCLDSFCARGGGGGGGGGGSGPNNTRPLTGFIVIDNTGVDCICDEDE